MLDLDKKGLEQVLQAMDEPLYRASQIMKWIWGKNCNDFSSMTNVSKKLRLRLDQEYTIEPPGVARAARSSDGTIKLLLLLKDGKSVESVLIPAGDHYTQCLSTQVGCALGCQFCSTGTMGFERQMSAGEIAGQVLAARRYLLGSGNLMPVNNLVLMGMGEPLLNWKQVHQALQIFRCPDALNFSRRKITLSTAGVSGGLNKLGQSQLCYLAVSLHAPDQTTRQAIMPGASAHHLDNLIKDMETYPLAPRERITIEYMLLRGVNDSLRQAGELCKILSKVKCKINLLRFNPGVDSSFQSSTEESVEAFQDFLRSKGFTVMLRKSMGADIQAACGQLKADVIRS
ncbi:23S rRNA (adenine(2503)-C(2))-methyltransferase RlmN [Desulfonatronovibrio magnus]|uniref:23S rRNA (adenine(2503)-C(2))-methyltransferase RlmN n=1 Tax=Desulfonatronovibrio magnus TaxID=698827 RepID=UPI000A5E06D0